MTGVFRRSRISIAAAAFVAVLFAASALAAATRTTADNAYVVHNLVSDVPGVADHVDPNLVNAWGLTSLPTSPWWVADNGTDVSTIYQADGTARPLVVKVRNAPTGAVSNAGPNFVVSKDGRSGPALFLFATEQGKILGWNPNVEAARAVVAADRSGVGAIYKGLATAPEPAG